MSDSRLEIISIFVSIAGVVMAILSFIFYFVLPDNVSLDTIILLSDNIGTLFLFMGLTYLLIGGIAWLLTHNK